MGDRRRVGIAFCAIVGLSVAGVLPGLAGAKPGDVIVGDSGAGEVVRLKPKTGNVSLISDDPRLDDPNDSVFGPNGKLYVADYGAFANTGAVFEINPKTENTKVLAKEAPFVDGNGELVRVDPATGDVVAFTQPAYSGGDGLTRGADGTLYAVDTSAQELQAA